MRITPKGLYGKLIFLVSLIVVAASFLSGIIIYTQQTTRIESNARENVMLMAKNLSLACADYLLVKDYATMEQYLMRFAEFQNVVEIQVNDEGGAVLSRVVHEQGAAPRSLYGSKPPDTPRLSSSSRPLVKIEKGHMLAVHPISAGNTILGEVLLRYRLAEISYIQGAILKNILLAGALGTLLSLTSLLIVLTAPVRLIKKITAFARRLDEIKGETMPVQRSFAEIEQLCEALNYASQKIYTTERALIRHRDDLEDQVSARTAELSHANELQQQELNERKLVEDALRKSREELLKAYEELKATQSRLLQNEKMASIGQLAAGIAHEINNPIGFIISNFGSLDKYIGRLKEFIEAQSEALKDDKFDREALAAELDEKRKGLKLDYIMDDVNQLLKESLDGAERVKRIVQDLKTFSHVDAVEFKMDDINAGLDSTLNILWNELKYKTTVKREYGEIPSTWCNLGQLNQVFMNIISNAAQAIEKQGEITIKTWVDGKSIFISISDTGCGIPEAHLNKLFEPFFTTKEVGKGTGLGLSIAYDIVKKHNGEINVHSEAGRGTVFTIQVPITRE